METASLRMVLSGAMSHIIISNSKKIRRGGVRISIKAVENKKTIDVLRLINKLK
jgi:hypothetical protein